MLCSSVTISNAKTIVTEIATHWRWMSLTLIVKFNIAKKFEPNAENMIEQNFQINSQQFA